MVHTDYEILLSHIYVGYKTESKLRHRQQYGGDQRRGDGGERKMKSVKRAKYMVMEDDRLWVVGTQFNIQVMYHRNVQL